MCLTLELVVDVQFVPPSAPGNVVWTITSGCTCTAICEESCDEPCELGSSVIVVSELLEGILG